MLAPLVQFLPSCLKQRWLSLLELSGRSSSPTSCMLENATPAHFTSALLNITEKDLILKPEAVVIGTSGILDAGLETKGLRVG